MNQFSQRIILDLEITLSYFRPKRIDNINKTRYEQEIPRAMSDQKTFHLLMVVMTHHDNHRTRGATDGTDELTFLGRPHQIYLSILARHG